MFGKKKKKPSIQISQPSNFQHRVHTGFDWENGKFVGLPTQWASIIDDKEKFPTKVENNLDVHTSVRLDLSVKFKLGLRRSFLRNFVIIKKFAHTLTKGSAFSLEDSAPETPWHLTIPTWREMLL